MLNQVNSKKQGDVGLGVAIGYYCTLGYTVNIPLTDSQDYDLIVDDGCSLFKVQVKTTRYKTSSGYYQANLKVCGGNRSGQTIKKFDSSKVDILFVLTDEGTRYNIPTSEVTSTTGVTLSPKFNNYIV